MKKSKSKFLEAIKAATSIAGMVALAFLIFGFTENFDAKASARPKVKSAKKLSAPNQAQSFLRNNVWRTSECEKYHGFQIFNLNRPQKVEVGNGKPGDGETLDIVYSGRTGDIIEIKTKVCAPVGCNQTLEEYKILNQNQIQEWRFEGHLPNEAPNIVVANGVASDGSAGRVFNRCRS